MRITLGLRDTTPEDVTVLVSEDQPVVLTRERERTTFQRVVSDLRVVFSDLDGSLAKKLASAPATSHWRVEVWEGERRQFVGEIDLATSSFGAASEYVTANVFSLDRLFWDLAKSSRIFAPSGSFEERGLAYTTVDYVLEREFHHNSSILEIFTEVDIDPLYSGRPIRGWMDAAASGDPTIGNNGRYRELSPTTTLFELLSAMATYYNAEFFVDPETGHFNMRRRLDVLKDRRIPIDPVLSEDANPAVLFLDDDKYDWILVTMQVPRPPAPIFVGTSQADPGRGIFFPVKYRVTNVQAVGGGLSIESDGGAESVYLRRPGTLHAYKVEMTVPVGPVGTTERRIWRQEWAIDFDADGNYVTPTPLSPYYLVGNIGNNSGTDYFDDYPQTWRTPGQTPLPTDTVNGETWFGYDEAAGVWRDPVKNDGTIAAPTGKILDVTPKLRFVSIADRNTELAANVLDVIAFFGGKKDFNLATFRDQWLPIFITRQRAEVTLQGLDYQVGDSMVSGGRIGAFAQIPEKTFAIKKAQSNLNTEETAVVLISAKGPPAAGGGGGGGGFDPIAAGYPVLFWAATRRMTGHVDGDNVPSWTDFSGHGNHAVQADPAHQPVYKTGGKNGLPYVHFADPRNVVTPAAPGSTGYTIFMIFKRDTDTGPGNSQSFLFNAARFLMQIYVSGAGSGLDNHIVMTTGNGVVYNTGHTYGDTPSLAGVWYLMTYVRPTTTGTGEIKLNGISAGTDSSTVNLAPPALQIGMTCDADVSEMMIVDGPMTPAQIANLVGMFTSIYGSFP